MRKKVIGGIDVSARNGKVTVAEIAELAALSRQEQGQFLSAAARKTPPRDVKDSNKGRFYAYQHGLSPSVVRAMREHGHGQLIMSGTGANSGRWYFPIEIFEAAVKASKSSQAKSRRMVAARKFEEVCNAGK